LAEHLAAVAHAENAARKSDESEALGYGVGLLTWVLAGGVFVAAKAAVEELPPWTLVFFRVLIAALVLLPFVARHFGAMRDLVRARGLEAFVIGAIGLGLTQGLMFIGLGYTSAVNAGIVFAISPILTLVLARIVLGEPLGPWQAVGSLVAFGGIVLIAVRGSWATLLSLDVSVGDLIILAAALLFSNYNVMLRRAKFAVPRLPLLVVLLFSGVIAVAPFFVAEIVEGAHDSLALTGTLALLYAAIPGGAIMYLLFNWSVDILGAGRAGGLMYSQMVFTAILAFLILGEPIAWFQYAGAGLIVAGVVLITLLKAAPPPTPPSR
jgi:drug/metabolite transporter (DMT)-like permease